MSDLRERFVRDLRDLIKAEAAIAVAEQSLRDSAGKHEYNRRGVRMTIPTREQLDNVALLLPLTENPGFRQLAVGTGQSRVRTQKEEQPGILAARWVPIASALCLALGILSLFVGFNAATASASASVNAATTANATPTVPMLLPIPTLGLPHTGSAAPDIFSFQVGTFNGSWMITSYAEDEGAGTLLYGRGGVKTSELAHYGAYPGEPGNMVLAGSETAFSQYPPQRLTVNDFVDVKDKAGHTFSYQIVPCDPDIGRKECITGGFDEWAAGRTPVEKILYQKSDGDVVEEETCCELTILIALNPAPDTGGIGPAPTPDPYTYRNYILRAKLIGNKK